jgi:hypothetical protein
MPLMRQAKRWVCGIGASLAVLVAVGCIFTSVNVEEVRPSVEGTVVRSPLKAHMVDGSTVVFRNGAIVSSTQVRGDGSRFPLDGGSPIPANSVAIDSIVGMESYQTKIGTAQTVFTSAAVTVVAAAATAAALVAIFGSCPTFYSDSAGTAVLEAEGFSYSIAPLFEQRDVDRLRATVGADGQLHIEVRNEALETHYINHLEILEARHLRNELVVPDERGRPIALRELRAPAQARDRSGRDVALLLASADGSVFSTAAVTLARADSSDLEDYIDLVVPHPPSGDSIAIMFRLRNSLLNTVLLYDNMLADPGAASLDWLGSDVQKISTAVDLGRWYGKHMGMRISVLDENGYRDVARFSDKGPIAFHDIAVVIPVPKGDSAHIRLSFVADDWRIDRIAIASSFRRPLTRTVALSGVVGSDGLPNPAALRSLQSPDDKYLVTNPGQQFSVRFTPGTISADSTRTFLLVSQGYYTEWVRGAWLKRSAKSKPFVPSASALASALAGWRTQQRTLEQQFYSSRIPTR